MRKKRNPKDQCDPKTSDSSAEGRRPRDRDGKRSDGKQNSSPNATSGVFDVTKLPHKNDWKFYAVNELLAKQVASIPFNVLTGAPLPVTVLNYMGSESKVIRGNRSAVAVARIDYVPAVGVSGGSTSGISLAANQLYAEMRAANSGAKNYEAPDLLMFVIAVQDLYRNIMEAMRTLSMVGVYDFANKTLPKHIIELGMCYDYADLSANRAQYLARLNTLISASNAFGIPAYFTGLLRRLFIAGNVFMDSDAIRGQYYVFKSRGYYVWSPTTSSAGSSLKYVDFAYEFGSNGVPNPPSTFDAMLDAIEDQITALMSDSDALTMEGDILKAWGPDKLYKMPMLDGDTRCVPICDEDILAQIENMIVAPGSFFFSGELTATTTGFGSSLDVTQIGGNAIIWQPVLGMVGTSDTNSVPVIGARAFNSHKIDPSYTDTLEWTRLSAVWGTSAVDDGGKAKLSVVACGTELPINMAIFLLQWDTTGKTTALGTTFQQLPTDTNAAGVFLLAVVAQLDWHPAVYVYSPGSSTITGVAMDTKVCTVIDSDTMIRIHESVNYAVYYNHNAGVAVK